MITSHTNLYGMVTSAACSGSEIWIPPAGWESGLCPVAYFSFDEATSYTWMKDSDEIDPPELSQVDGVVSAILSHSAITNLYLDCCLV